MNQDASQFVGGVPENYDSHLGPILFDDYGDDIAARAAACNATAVLEVAAGTGIVSRKLRDALPADVPLTATDLNPPMLAVAGSKFQSGENVSFQQADALDLPFDDNAFDLVVCQFGIMFYPDRHKGYQEVLRVLRPGGTYLFSTWGDHAANPFARITHEAVGRFFPDDPPQFYTVPFSCADTEAVQAEARTAGFQSITGETIAVERQMKDWTSFVQGLVYGNPLIGEIESRGGVDVQEVFQAILDALTAELGAAPSSMPLSATMFLGRAP